MPSPKHMLAREINLGPLVDLSLVLLILLVVVVPMLRRDPVPPPARPAAARAPQVPVNPLAVALGADGAVFVEQRRVGREELPEILLALHVAGPDRPVLVKGDRRLRYREVRQLMAELYRAGFQGVSLAPEA